MPLRPTTQRKRSMSHDYCNSSIDKLELIDSSPDRKLMKRDSCDSMHKTSLSGTFLVYSEDDTDESARFREMTAVAANANYRTGVDDDAYAGGELLLTNSRVASGSSNNGVRSKLVKFIIVSVKLPVSLIAVILLTSSIAILTSALL